MNKALESIVASHPLSDSAQCWKEAIAEAGKLPIQRGVKETPKERMVRLRDSLRGELVAFHDKLVVSPSADRPGGADGTRTWDVQVPLTLFPKRDRGFTRVECMVEFRAESDDARTFRLVELLPQERSDVFATGAIGGELQLNSQLGMKLPVPMFSGVSVVEAQAKVYGQASAHFEYKAERKCVVAEIVRGTGARWRLDDLRNQANVGTESHQLKAVLEVSPAAGPIHAAGYLNAYSEEQWMTQHISDILGKLTTSVLTFFKRGGPTEAYAEWSNILRV